MSQGLLIVNCMKNNNLIFTEEFNKQLKYEVSKVKDSLIIVSAFSKLNMLKEIDEILDKNVKEKILLVRWRYIDLKNGATDLGLYKYCEENHWNLYINLDLHAKIYAFDKKKAIVGSANLTSSGIGECNSPNIEAMTCINIDKKQYDDILNIVKFSTLLTKELFNSCIKELELISCGTVEKTNWSNELQILFNNNEIKIWSNELLFSESPKNLDAHDKFLLKINNNITNNELKIKFKDSKIYKWLLNNIDDFYFFGQLSKKLQNDLLDNDIIYKKDVKVLLRNLFNWIEELNMEDFKIDRPNYSQRIRRRKNEFY